MILSSLSETSKTAGSAGFRLTATGSSLYVSTAALDQPSIFFDGVSYDTYRVSGNSCYADIPASALTTPRTVDVHLETDRGDVSNSLSFTITPALPSISSISPSSATAPATVTIDVYGANFASACVIRLDGSDQTTTFIDSGHLRMASHSFAAGASHIITVNYPGVGESSGTTFTANNPVPTITSFSPSTKTVGDADFTLTVNGTGFISGVSQVAWNGTYRTTTYVSSTQLQATISTADLGSAGHPTIAVVNATPGGGTATDTTSFTINNPVPVISSVSPATFNAGSSTTTITVTGSNIVGGTGATVAQWNGVNQTTTVVNPTTVTFTATASMLSTAGTYTVTLYNGGPGGGTSTASKTVTVAYPTPVLSSISPASGLVGSTTTITCTGSNFQPSSVIYVNGNARTTTYGSSTTLTATLLSGDVSYAQRLSITVGTAGNLSSAILYGVNNPVPTITSLSSTSVLVGSTGMNVTITGTNYVTGSQVLVNGSTRPATVASSTSITAALQTSDFATAGTLSIQVMNPSPGGGTSSGATFTVNNPAPVLTSISPTSANVGGSSFTMTLNGSGFVPSSSVLWGGSARTTTYVSATQLTATINGSDIASTGTTSVTVSNVSPGGGTSSAQTFTTTYPVPTITSISPTSVAAGNGTFSLTINGTGFVSGVSTAYWNGASRTTTFVSSTQVTATINATDVTAAASASVTVQNTGPGGGTSNTFTFYVGSTNPVPTISSLSPGNCVQNSSAFTLGVTGTNFVNGAVVQWSGENRTTTFVSSTALQASILTTDLIAPGSYTVTVVNPQPGGGASGNATFTVTAANPAPTISTLSPQSATAGGSAFTLTVNGSNFINGSTVQWNGSARTTTFVNSSQLTAAITATDIASSGSATVSVTTPSPGGGTSQNLTFTIASVSNNPVPTITSISTTSAAVGSSGFTLTVTGTGFYSGSVARWAGSSRTTTYVSSTQLQMAITTSDLSVAGVYSLSVFNTTPGGGTSNSYDFQVLAPTNPVPTITALSPASVTKGASAFTLTVKGTNVLPSTTVQVNGFTRTPHYQSSTRVDADILASDVASSLGTVSKINPRAHTENVTVNAQVVRAFVPGSATAPAITVGANDTSSGLFSLTPGTVGIAANGTHAVQVTSTTTSVLNALTVSGNVSVPYVSFSTSGKYIDNGGNALLGTLTATNVNITGTANIGSGGLLTFGEANAAYVYGSGAGVFTSLTTSLQFFGNQAGTYAAQPAFSFDLDTDTGVFSPGSNTLAVSTGGVERWRIDSSGNVGIGTTPSARLHIVGNALFATAGGTTAGNAGNLSITTGGTSPIPNRIAFGTDGTGYKFAISKNQGGTVTDIVTIGDNSNVTIAGTITERGRSTAMGEWIDVPFNAANFTCDAGTWTVTSGNVTTYKYTVVGKTMTVAISISTSTLSSNPQSLIFPVPGGFTAAATVCSVAALRIGGSTQTAWISSNNGQAYLYVQPQFFSPTNFPTGTTQLYASITFPVQ